MKDAWIRTYSGGKVYFFEPEKSNIQFEDISHSLSMLCRFNGATQEFYSVAQHSVLVAKEVYKETEDKKISFTALMHDASEAFISDIPSPFKSEFEGYKIAEKRMEEWLAKRFKYQYPHGGIVKKHDLKALSTEMRDLMSVCDNKDIAVPYDQQIIPLSPRSAEYEFLNMADFLTK